MVIYANSLELKYIYLPSLYTMLLFQREMSLSYKSPFIPQRLPDPGV